MDRYTIAYRHRKYFGPKADVCVVVSNYNYAHFLPECLNSLTEQSLKQIRLVVVDDRSDDGSLSYLKNFLKRNKRRFTAIDLLVHDENFGPVSARNTGIRHGQSKYFFILDADNILLPQCLERLYDAMEYSEAQFAYGICARFGDAHDLLSYFPWDRQRLKSGNYIDIMSMIRRDWLERMNYFSVNECTLYGWEDYDFWIKTALNDGAGVFIPQVLARYRSHPESRTVISANPKTELMMAVLKDLYPRLWSE